MGISFMPFALATLNITSVDDRINRVFSEGTPIYPNNRSLGLQSNDTAGMLETKCFYARVPREHPITTITDRRWERRTDNESSWQEYDDDDGNVEYEQDLTLRPGTLFGRVYWPTNWNRSRKAGQYRFVITGTDGDGTERTESSGTRTILIASSSDNDKRR